MSYMLMSTEEKLRKTCRRHKHEVGDVQAGATVTAQDINTVDVASQIHNISG